MNPSAQVLPTVRLLLPCGEAAFSLDDGVWIVRNPWAVLTPPAGMPFPFRLREVWFYAQLAGGVGTVEISVEALEVREDGTRRQIGVAGQTRRLDIPPGNPLIPVQSAFSMKRVPLRAEGVYEFRLIAGTSDGYQALSGQTATLRAVDTGRRL